MKYYFSAFKNYAKSDGRATRKEFWWFILFHYLFAFAFAFIDAIFDFYPKISTDYNVYSFDYGYTSLVYLIATACPSICLQIRRLHDIGKSGNWWFVGKIPILSLYLLYLNCKASEPKTNVYGPPANETVKINLPELENVTITADSIIKIQTEENVIDFKENNQNQLNREEYTGSDLTLEKPVKIKYCSQCGSQIDSVTKKCTGCGKQYFRGIKIKLSKVSVVIVLMSLVIVVVSGFSIWQYLNTQNLKNDIMVLETELKNKKIYITRIEEQVDDLENEMTKNKRKINFFDNHAVIVPNDGTYTYHKWDCSRLDTSEGFWIYNTEAAQGDYYKCPYCN